MSDKTELKRWENALKVTEHLGHGKGQREYCFDAYSADEADTLIASLRQEVALLKESLDTQREGRKYLRTALAEKDKQIEAQKSIIDANSAFMLEAASDLGSYPQGRVLTIAYKLRAAANGEGSDSAQ